jgi:hypothetical protein
MKPLIVGLKARPRLDPPAPSDHADYFDCPPATDVCFRDAISCYVHLQRRDPWARNDLVEENS